MPDILSGLRIPLALAIIALVAAKRLRAECGIGVYTLQAGSRYDLERLFQGAPILSLLGVIVSAGISLIARSLPGWQVGNGRGKT